MDQINEKLLEFLVSEFDPGEKKYMAITLKFEFAIKSGLMPPGSLFPTQKWVENFYNVGEKVSMAVWKELKVRKMIHTRTSGGTSVADILYTEDDGTYREENIPSPDNSRVVMDQLPIVDRYGYKGHFAPILNRTKSGFSHLSYDERNLKTVPAFSRWCKNLINARPGSAFSKQEVHYSQDSHLQIFAVVQTYLSKEVFVMARPASDMVTDAVREAGKEMIIIGADQMGINTYELEKVCRERKVGIVYISSRAPYPSECVISDKKMDHLLVLQQQYGFLIFFNDTYPVPGAGHVRIYKEVSTNPNMIYLGPLSLLDTSLYGISILVAKEAEMKKISQKFIGVGRLAEPKLVYAALHLLKSGVILRHEKKHYKSITLVYLAAVKALNESGLWKEEGLYSAIGWLCYLEPKIGSLPSNAFELLSKANIFVFDPQRFDGGPEFSKGICISLGTKKSEKQVINDIEKINTILNIGYKKNAHQ